MVKPVVILKLVWADNILPRIIQKAAWNWTGRIRGFSFEIFTFYQNSKIRNFCQIQIWFRYQVILFLIRILCSNSWHVLSHLNVSSIRIMIGQFQNFVIRIWPFLYKIYKMYIMTGILDAEIIPWEETVHF